MVEYVLSDRSQDSGKRNGVLQMGDVVARHSMAYTRAVIFGEQGVDTGRKAGLSLVAVSNSRWPWMPSIQTTD